MAVGLLKRVRGALMVTTLAAITALPVQADTLRQVMVDAYRHSDLLEQNRYLLRIQDEGVAQAVAQLRPVFSFVASIERDIINDTSNASASLVAEYLLYDGGARRFALEAAEETVLAARQQLVSLEQQVLFDAVTAYMNVWRDIQIVGVRERNVRVITQQLRAARDRFEVGEDTRTDVAQAEAQLATARSQLAGAQGALDISRELFNLAIGRYPNGLSGPGAVPNVPRTEVAAQNLARQQHPAIRALQHEVTAAELGIEQARAGLRPQLSLDGRATEVFENTANPFAEGSSATIGLTLTQPLYRGGQLLSLERQSRAQAAAVRFSLSQQVRINLQGVGNAWALMRIASAQIQAADQRIAAAELAFAGVQEEASLGARTTLDVLDAEQDVLDARISRIEAQTDLYTASYQLLSASGLLTVEALHLNVPQYDPAAYANMFSGAPSLVNSPRGAQLDSVLERLGRD
ncbi:TolC family outer membrane protein [Jannaschia sp. CCS1]|uniref:TolC family outer membrane protein n=1 Tax=Jannaschia sp. (strain CCS1) TaxID=290400 RepID=UPI000053BCAB|nr:TolC family outer membrane protein [Jannaschia sp. CCS1]ABD56174.1 Type I secretion outer membrane protein TolC [Jannaschia sp. CCS1]